MATIDEKLQRFENPARCDDPDQVGCHHLDAVHTTGGRCLGATDEGPMTCKCRALRRRI